MVAKWVSWSLSMSRVGGLVPRSEAGILGKHRIVLRSPRTAGVLLDGSECWLGRTDVLLSVWASDLSFIIEFRSTDWFEAANWTRGRDLCWADCHSPPVLPFFGWSRPSANPVGRPSVLPLGPRSSVDCLHLSLCSGPGLPL